MTVGSADGDILVIDDNPENRALAQAALEDEGYDVRLATNGPDGLTEFAANRPDCVLLDIRMPGMDGIEVCKRMREHADAAEIPILFLTAQRDVDTFDRAQDNAVKQRRLAAERAAAPPAR